MVNVPGSPTPSQKYFRHTTGQLDPPRCWGKLKRSNIGVSHTLTVWHTKLTWTCHNCIGWPTVYATQIPPSQYQKKESGRVTYLCMMLLELRSWDCVHSSGKSSITELWLKYCIRTWCKHSVTWPTRHINGAWNSYRISFFRGIFFGF